MEEFLNWCRHRDFKIEGVEVRSSGEGAGNGIFAARSYRRDERVIRMNDMYLITAGMVADTPFYAIILEAADIKLNPFEVLTLFFCMEKSPKSEWTPYLDVLPQVFGTPAFQEKEYDPNDMPLSIRSFYDTQLKDIRSNFRNITTVVPSIDFRTFIWAWHIVNTRCIYVDNRHHYRIDCTDGDNLAVIPFVDMFNHEPVEQCVALHFKACKTYEVLAARCIQPGEELHVTYGPHDNLRLYIEYGFVIDNNMNGKVIIPKDLFLVLAHNAGIEIHDKLERVIYEADVPTTLYKSDEGAGYSFRTNIRILLLNKKELDKWQEIVYREHSQDSDEDELDDSLIRENEIIEKMMMELLPSIEQKREKAHPEIQWMWDDQILIVQKVLETVQSEENSN
ncbi:unnamed protein product [Auanema sp. JU1783]|nr:unnamed protein product [Auanema sp. JU1783]